MEKTRCNNCMKMFEDEEDLKFVEDLGGGVRVCPNCGTEAYLMDLEE